MRSPGATRRSPRSSARAGGWPRRRNSSRRWMRTAWTSRSRSAMAGATSPVAREANDCLLDAASRFPHRIIAFCAVHPAWGDEALREIERCADAGARGIGELHPTSQGVDLASGASVEPIAQFAAARGLPIVVHGSEPVGHAYAGKGETTPDQLLAAALRFPDVTWVFAHWGGGLPFYALMPEVREALANAYFDSAASPFLYDAEVFSVASRSGGRGAHPVRLGLPPAAGRTCHRAGAGYARRS